MRGKKEAVLECLEGLCLIPEKDLIPLFSLFLLILTVYPKPLSLPWGGGAGLGVRFLFSHFLTMKSGLSLPLYTFQRHFLEDKL